MSVASDKKELLTHLEHEIIIVPIGDKDSPSSITVECKTCKVILYEEDE